MAAVPATAMRRRCASLLARAMVKDASDVTAGDGRREQQQQQEVGLLPSIEDEARRDQHRDLPSADAHWGVVGEEGRDGQDDKRQTIEVHQRSRLGGSTAVTAVA
jgi:hypothetical protein